MTTSTLRRCSPSRQSRNFSVVSKSILNINVFQAAGFAFATTLRLNAMLNNQAHVLYGRFRNCSNEIRWLNGSPVNGAKATARDFSTDAAIHQIGRSSHLHIVDEFVKVDGREEVKIVG